MKMIYKSKEANLKHAESLVSTGDKFYWVPHLMIFGYFFNLKNISEIGSSLYIMIIIFVISISIGLLLRIKGLKVYDYIYRQNIKKTSTQELLNSSNYYFKSNFEVTANIQSDAMFFNSYVISKINREL